MKNNQTPQPPGHPGKHKNLTPLQQLIADKMELRRRCREEQKLVSEEWQYIREHSGSLILSGIVDLFFPHRKHPVETVAGAGKSDFWEKITTNLPYYLSILREGLSIIWYISRPFYLKWAISRKKRE